MKVGISRIGLTRDQKINTEGYKQNTEGYKQNVHHVVWWEGSIDMVVPMDDIVEAYCTYAEKPNAERHTLFISQLDTKKTWNI